MTKTAGKPIARKKPARKSAKPPLDIKGKKQGVAVRFSKDFKFVGSK